MIRDVVPHMRRELLSPSYTTDWSELLVVKLSGQAHFRGPRIEAELSSRTPLDWQETADSVEKVGF